MSQKLISIVIPAYNEGANVRTVSAALEGVMSGSGYDYRVLFVDDGSSDDTLEHIKELAAPADSKVRYISFSRNFGHQSAVKAGYEQAPGACVITMDCDMQHPPELIPDMLRLWEAGWQVVYTRREEDTRLPWTKRFTSRLFYRVLNLISNVGIEPGAADFRLLDRAAVDAVNALPERDPFIRGIVKWVGFKQIGIDYLPHERVAGESKYTFRKMFALAIRGVTSFSLKPLYFAIWMGATIASLSMLYLPYVIYSVATNHAAAGWSSLLLTVAFLGSLQLIILGIIGVYIGKLIIQTKCRPEYIVNQIYLDGKNENRP